MFRSWSLRQDRRSSRNLTRQMRTDEQGPVGSVQGWGDRDHHHSHGVGDEGATRRPVGGPGARSANISKLCLEFFLRRHLLEQPPPFAADVHLSNRYDALGQSASLVLALAISVYHRLDGRKPLHRGAYRALRSGVVDGRNLLFTALADHHRRPRTGFSPEESDWTRLERETIDAAVCWSHCRHIAVFVLCPGYSSDRGADMVDSMTGVSKRGLRHNGTGLSSRTNRYARWIPILSVTPLLSLTQ